MANAGEHGLLLEAAVAARSLGVPVEHVHDAQTTTVASHNVEQVVDGVQRRRDLSIIVTESHALQ
jgi:hypothetical protein